MALIERIRMIQENLAIELKYAQDSYKEFADRHRLPTPTFAPGSQVWLSTRNLTTTRPTKKFDYKRLGPFKVLETHQGRVYKLELPTSMSKLHPWFHPSLLEPVGTNDVPNRTVPPPPPVVIDQEVQHEVSSILDSRIRSRKLQYKVSWEGYGPEYDTWEPSQSILEDVPSLARAFHLHHPHKPVDPIGSARTP